MRFLIIVKANDMTEAETMPGEKLISDMANYMEELVRAGVLLDGNGLKPTKYGARIRYEGDRRVVTDGPFTEAKELIAGYTLIQVKSREEAIEWARRFPNPYGEGAEAEIELRELWEVQDFGDSEGVEHHLRIREKIGVASG
jgi:hypothetical protein